MNDTLGGNWESDMAKSMDLSNAVSTRVIKKSMMDTMMIEMLMGFQIPIGADGVMGVPSPKTSYLDCDFAKFQRHPIFWLLRSIFWNEEGGSRTTPWAMKNFSNFFHFFDTEYLARILAITLAAGLYPKIIFPVLNGIDIFTTEKKLGDIFGEVVDTVNITDFMNYVIYVYNMLFQLNFHLNFSHLQLSI